MPDERTERLTAQQQSAAAPASTPLASTPLASTPLASTPASTRRRGEALRAAIHAAVLAELTESGYADLTMERVADRAGAGKASLYRRWNSRAELVRDTAYHLMRDTQGVPDTGSLRGDLIAMLGQTARLLASPLGSALRALLSEMLADRVAAGELSALSLGMGRQLMSEVVERAIARGEMTADAVTDLRLDVGQALMRDRFLFRAATVDAATATDIVDQVLLPLFASPTTASPSPRNT
ncbi:TetR/AcrR family transcriptional regulator [Microbacterium sp. H1-D42]|uniref:TetR/AcrR family transcriptional regulator n=1 Tax=Microbacterium sp. H1-D42 TaxID=2925844 RepID=UPI001F52D79F|nr:TetR/AcrR family transcriptional regulator [Microbacterium sp. H1-D42]UNK70880.1 TetR/AcrR family transcriptional regulator [Microbacterium sp. H1-D42]